MLNQFLSSILKHLLMGASSDLDSKPLAFVGELD